ncbi:MAG: hypothetical protein CVU53_06320 [Deltaproteobacteria bacterium HGW-Deltaproteobacteria-11]|nr:MAG: hypothetical protein CVU53_06320 [Deltaproteobacteria bacterium HGW-Deltaproteobacteria-11]
MRASSRASTLDRNCLLPSGSIELISICIYVIRRRLPGSGAETEKKLTQPLPPVKKEILKK